MRRGAILKLLTYLPPYPQAILKLLTYLPPYPQAILKFANNLVRVFAHTAAMLLTVSE